MACAREHIDRPDLFESIACGGKELTVTGEGCRVAGNIGNTVNAACNYGLDGLRVGALSRWVEDEGGKILLFGSQKLRNDILHGSADEFCIGDAVFYRIGLCILDGGGYDLNAEHMLRPLCRKQRDSPDTAVKVDNGIGGLDIERIYRNGVELQRFRGIDLQKALGTHIETELAEPISNGGTPENGTAFPAHDEIGIVGIYVVND